MYKSTFVYSVLALCVSLAGATVVADEPTLGTWTNNEETRTYGFLETNKLTFSRVNLLYSDGVMKRSREHTVDGLWREGASICNRGKQTGNVMMYVNKRQCCMLVQHLGEKLILTKVWGKTSSYGDICDNAVLSRKYKRSP